MTPDTPRPTRAAIFGSLVVLTYLWVFLIAIVLQNTRPSAAAETPAANYVSHEMVLMVDATDHVYTIEHGVMTQQVALMECPKTFMITSSELAPLIELVDATSLNAQAAYSMRVDRPFAVISSRTGLEIQFDDGAQVSLKVACQPNRSEVHYAAIFVRAGIVELADMSSGTVVPLFYLEDTCQLVWEQQGSEQRAFQWEMSIPVTSIDVSFEDATAIAFTFSTRGAAQLNMTRADQVEIISASGIVTLYTDCDTPVLMPHASP